VNALTASGRQPSYLRFLARLYRNRVGFSGLLLSLVVVIGALGAPLLTPYTPREQNIRERFDPPNVEHPMGTDNFGRDVLTRVLHGYRISVGIAVLAVSLAVSVGGTVGLIAAYYGGWADRVLMRLMDVLLAFPVILLAIGILAVLGPGSLNTSLAIGVVYMPVFARLARGPALSVLSWDFVMAARALGSRGSRIMFAHVAPNIFAPIIVQVTLSLSTAILVEAALSFLGLGTQPPTPSLGLMLSESRGYMLISPWTSVFSGLAILVAALGFNLLGDGLRDLLDPTLRDISS
jgi:peptide/nickel transport system permease protein